MFKSQLFNRAFKRIVLGVITLAVLFYLFTVPLVREMTYKMEENSARTVMNDIYHLVQQNSEDLGTWRTMLLEAHKKDLKNVTGLFESYIRSAQLEAAEKGISREAAAQKIFKRARLMNYGNKDYVWIADYNYFMLSHPDPQLDQRDFSKIVDVHGQPIIPPMVDGAKRNGEGYHSYWWRRLGQDKPMEKITYYKAIPELGWVIGTGVYIYDIEAEVQKRKQQMIEKLRRHLRTTPIAGTGYVYIFDSKFNMIIHPNSNIEKTNVSALLDPVTKKPLVEELVKAAGEPGNKLVYRWDKPDDPGNYTYEKISWVRYVKEMDWYVASSVYTGELRQSSNILSLRILFVTIIGLVGALIFGYTFLRSLLKPINLLSEAANRVSEGDLSANCEVTGTDEIGVLAKAFNAMVNRLKDQIEHLEIRVSERTEELSCWIRELEQRNRDIAVFNRMGDLLQACLTHEETYNIVTKTISELFPESSGALLIFNNSRTRLNSVCTWGEPCGARENSYHIQDDCWALRLGNTYYLEDVSTGQPCRHVSPDSRGSSLCVLLISQGEVLGVLHILTSTRREGMQRLSETVAEHAALAMANLQLRETLRQQSIRDTLTGLYNRRYLEESLDRESSRARRSGNETGIIMIDIDHFKQLNDTYGHDAGDAVLRDFGNLLKRSLRGEDIACRYGGEEFIIIMPAADIESCRQKGEDLRHAVESELSVKWRESTLHVTISAGVAVFSKETSDIKDVIHAADAAMYAAKKSGRNRVEISALSKPAAEL